MDKKRYKGYRIDSNRKKNHDYSKGIYFITICVDKSIKDYQVIFGEIIEGEMILNKVGELVNKYWMEIPEHFSNTKLDEFIVMPDHIHGILILERTHNQNNRRPRDDAMHHLNTRNPNRIGNYFSIISPKSKSLATIIRSYKSICTREINKISKIHFKWQSNYHDRIVRSKEDLERIRYYIKNNPANYSKH